jgi:hypothetical protein
MNKDRFAAYAKTIGTERLAELLAEAEAEAAAAQRRRDLYRAALAAAQEASQP